MKVAWAPGLEWVESPGGPPRISIVAKSGDQVIKTCGWRVGVRELVCYAEQTPNIQLSTARWAGPDALLDLDGLGLELAIAGWATNVVEIHGFPQGPHGTKRAPDAQSG